MLNGVYNYVSKKVFKIVGRRAVKMGLIALVSMCSPMPVATFVGFETVSVLL